MYVNCPVYHDFVDDPSELAVGQMYRDKARLQLTLCKFAMRNHFQYKVLKSNKQRYTIKCLIDSCGWRLHASLLDNGGVFKIKTYRS
jgi:hypothetical protein